MVTIVSLNKYVFIYEKLCCNSDRTIFHPVLSSQRSGELRLKKFKKFYLEITSVCNLACSFCPPTERQKQFLSVEDFSKRLDQIKPHTYYIYLHVKDKPML